jgi:flagellar biogenesis protein FliO
MASIKQKTAAQKSGRLYTLVGFLVILLAFVAVTFFLLTRSSRNE